MTMQATAGTKDHPITIGSAKGHTKVSWKGAVIANSDKALDLKEANYPVVKYVPREDTDMRLLRRTNHMTHCPYKGDASYYSIVVDGKVSENAVWTYENPLPSVASIKGYLAFYPERVDRIEQS
jgi:uncharacterized protein (DUF427 family)